MQYSVCFTGRASWDLGGDLLLPLPVTGRAASCWPTDGKYHLDWEKPLRWPLHQDRFLSKLIHLDFHIWNPSSFWLTCPSVYPSTHSSTHLHILPPFYPAGSQHTRPHPWQGHEGESLTGKADQVFRGFEKLPPALTLKIISVFLMPASIDYSLISVTQAEGLPWSLPK